MDMHQRIANGINWAWQNGASVINGSWGGSRNDQFSHIVDNAIKNALQHGRGGKGCVIVFSSGNNDSPNNATFPANSDDDIIVVGALTHCGTRKTRTSNCDTERRWGSNHGVQLDIMAPGVLVPTTDLMGNEGYNPNIPVHLNYSGTIIPHDYANRDYTVWFNGTSAAAPHVSAVAALILSVNPNLTQKQVADIIESTARKVGGYPYHYNNPNRPNGSWHVEMGYGLVDAGAAVKTTLCMLPSRSFSGAVNTDTTVYGSNITVSNTTVQPGGKLTLTACGSINITGDFTVQPGASLEIKVSP
jgi:subtilisin family serine protease